MKWMVSLREKSRLAVSWTLLLLCIVAFLLALLLPLNALGLTAEESVLQKAFEDGQIVRLHILAEDDSPLAQQTKLAVRDAVLAAFGQEIATAGAKDADAVYALLSQQREAMCSLAEQTARQWGFDGSVTAQVGVLPLPEKAYGEVTLPAGEYRALRITLGKGEGQNWWCVLFPQLCLALASEEPWQTLPGQPDKAPDIQWESRTIFRHWILLPIDAAQETKPSES